MDKTFWLALFLIMVTGWAYRISRLRQSLKWMPFINPGSRPDKKDRISVIVPMKNEETNAQVCLEALLNQDYPDFEVIAVNDNSTDRTGEIIRALPRVIYVENRTPTPDGWTGKNFAIHQGISKATGNWLLFTDADTRHEPVSLSAALAHVQSRDLLLLTLLPRCLCETFLEKVIQPVAMALLGLWFPIRKINDPHSDVYFGNGQYLMLHRSLYEKLGGHEAVKGAFLEDFALAKKAKEAGVRTECAMGKDIYGTRMYADFNSIWRGWRRIFLHAFASRPGMLLMRAVETFLFSVLPFAVFLLPGMPVDMAGGFLFLTAVVLVITWRAYKIVDADAKFAIFHPLAGTLLMFFLIDAFVIALTKKKTVWR